MRTDFQLIDNAKGFPDLEQFRSSTSGAEVVFNGIVRTPNKALDVLYLEFEAYEALFYNEMKRIAESLESQFQINAIVLHHRIGRVLPGELRSHDHGSGDGIPTPRLDSRRANRPCDDDRCHREQALCDD